MCGFFDASSRWCVQSAGSVEAAINATCAQRQTARGVGMVACFRSVSYHCYTRDTSPPSFAFIHRIVNHLFHLNTWFKLYCPELMYKSILLMPGSCLNCFPHNSSCTRTPQTFNQQICEISEISPLYVIMKASTLRKRGEARLNLFAF